MEGVELSISDLRALRAERKHFKRGRDIYIRVPAPLLPHSGVFSGGPDPLDKTRRLTPEEQALVWMD